MWNFLKHIYYIFDQSFYLIGQTKKILNKKKYFSKNLRILGLLPSMFSTAELYLVKSLPILCHRFASLSA